MSPVAHPIGCARVLAVLVALVVLAGCQMTVAVDIRVNDDETGSVTVGVGLDDAALARAGDLDQQLRLDDVVAAGWEVSGPQEEPDGLTWVRASKTFADAEQFTLVMEELTGPDGAFQDWSLAETSSITGTEWRVDGTVDLTGGPAVFSDPELAESLGGDPFGGTLAEIEQEEGRPVAEMVDVRVSVLLPPDDDPKVVEASFADAEPTQVSVSAEERSALVSVFVVGLGALVVVLVVVVLVVGFRRLRA